MSEYNNNTEHAETSIINIINILYKGKFFIILFICLGSFFGIGFNFYQQLSQPVIESVSTIEILSSNDRTINDVKVNMLFYSDVIASEIEKELELKSLGSYSITPKKYGIYKISVIISDEKLAIDINNALISQFSDCLENEYQQQYEFEKQNINEKLLEVSESQLSADHIVELILSVNRSSVNILSEPTIQIAHDEKNLKVSIAFGAIVGFLLGVFFVLLRNWWKTNKKAIKL